MVDEATVVVDMLQLARLDGLCFWGFDNEWRGLALLGKCSLFCGLGDEGARTGAEFSLAHASLLLHDVKRVEGLQLFLFIS